MDGFIKALQLTTTSTIFSPYIGLSISWIWLAKILVTDLKLKKLSSSGSFQSDCESHKHWLQHVLPCR